MTVWFTSDWHFNHEKVRAFSKRDFPSMAEHDQRLIDQINACVAEHDTLWCLGDVSWHSIEWQVRQIRCKHRFLIWGNHDRHNFGKHFQLAEDVAETKINNGKEEHKVFLSHYPHAFWPSSHKGSFHLYGHMHQQREAWLDEKMPGRRSLDVGVDNAYKLLGAYRPFKDSEIIDILGCRPGHDDRAFYDELDRK